MALRTVPRHIPQRSAMVQIDSLGMPCIAFNTLEMSIEPEGIYTHRGIVYQVGRLPIPLEEPFVDYGTTFLSSALLFVCHFISASSALGEVANDWRKP